MIDPQTLPPDMDLEEFLLFSIVVAGKNAKVQSAKLETFLSTVQSGSPLHRVASMELAGVLEQNLKGVGMGQYNRIAAAFRGIIHARPRLDLLTCTPRDLERIKGIGPKTSRFFILHTRPGARYAVLDTHILRFLRENGYKDAPRSTPPAGASYRLLEAAFLRIADRIGMTPAALDLLIWNTYSKNGLKEVAGSVFGMRQEWVEVLPTKGGPIRLSQKDLTT